MQPRRDCRSWSFTVLLLSSLLFITDADTLRHDRENDKHKEDTNGKINRQMQDPLSYHSLLFGDVPSSFSDSDPRALSDDADSLLSDLISLEDDPRFLLDNPESLPDDPRSLPDDPRSLPDDPRSLPDDPKSLGNPKFPIPIDVDAAALREYRRFVYPPLTPRFHCDQGRPRPKSSAARQRSMFDLFWRLWRMDEPALKRYVKRKAQLTMSVCGRFVLRRLEKVHRPFLNRAWRNRFREPITCANDSNPESVGLRTGTESQQQGKGLPASEDTNQRQTAQTRINFSASPFKEALEHFAFEQQEKKEWNALVRYTNWALRELFLWTKRSQKHQKIKMKDAKGRFEEDELFPFLDKKEAASFFSKEAKGHWRKRYKERLRRMLLESEAGQGEEEDEDNSDDSDLLAEDSPDNNALLLKELSVDLLSSVCIKVHTLSRASQRKYECAFRHLYRFIMGRQPCIAGQGCRFVSSRDWFIQKTCESLLNVMRKDGERVGSESKLGLHHFFTARKRQLKFRRYGHKKHGMGKYRGRKRGRYSPKSGRKNLRKFDPDSSYGVKKGARKMFPVNRRQSARRLPRPQSPKRWYHRKRGARRPLRVPRRFCQKDGKGMVVCKFKMSVILNSKSDRGQKSRATKTTTAIHQASPEKQETTTPSLSPQRISSEVRESSSLQKKKNSSEPSMVDHVQPLDPVPARTVYVGTVEGKRVDTHRVDFWGPADDSETDSDRKDPRVSLRIHYKKSESGPNSFAPDAPSLRRKRRNADDDILVIPGMEDQEFPKIPIGIDSITKHDELEEFKKDVIFSRPKRSIVKAECGVKPIKFDVLRDRKRRKRKLFARKRKLAAKKRRQNKRQQLRKNKMKGKRHYEKEKPSPFLAERKTATLRFGYYTPMNKSERFKEYLRRQSIDKTQSEDSASADFSEGEIPDTSKGLAKSNGEVNNVSTYHNSRPNWQRLRQQLTRWRGKAGRMTDLQKLIAKAKKKSPVPRGKPFNRPTRPQSTRRPRLYDTLPRKKFSPAKGKSFGQKHGKRRFRCRLGKLCPRNGRKQGSIKREKDESRKEIAQTSSPPVQLASSDNQGTSTPAVSTLANAPKRYENPSVEKNGNRSESSTIDPGHRLDPVPLKTVYLGAVEGKRIKTHKLDVFGANKISENENPPVYVRVQYKKSGSNSNSYTPDATFLKRKRRSVSDDDGDGQRNVNNNDDNDRPQRQNRRRNQQRRRRLRQERRFQQRGNNPGLQDNDLNNNSDDNDENTVSVSVRRPQWRNRHFRNRQRVKADDSSDNQDDDDEDINNGSEDSDDGRLGFVQIVSHHSSSNRQRGGSYHQRRREEERLRNQRRRYNRRRRPQIQPQQHNRQHGGRQSRQPRVEDNEGDNDGSTTRSSNANSQLPQIQNINVHNDHGNNGNGNSRESEAYIRSPFINHRTAYDFLSSQARPRSRPRVQGSRPDNEQRAEQWQFSHRMSESLCEVFDKHFVPTNIGGRCE